MTLSLPGPETPGPNDLALQQQALLQQFMQVSFQRQNQLTQEVKQHEEDIALLFKKDRERDLEFNLITINQLDTMVGGNWSEKVKNRKGVELAAWCRKHHHPLKKVNHPSLPGGVNAYEPTAVKAWLEENGQPIPQELRYV